MSQLGIREGKMPAEEYQTPNKGQNSSLLLPQFSTLIVGPFQVEITENPTNFNKRGLILPTL